MNTIGGMLRTSGWKVLLLLAAAFAIPACASANYRTSPGGQTEPSGPTPP